MSGIIDYGNSFPNAIAAHGKDSNVLILHKLDQPFKRFDGKRARFEIEYRWLSTECRTESDEAWCCVSGSELTFWQNKEINLEAIRDGRKTLFDCFTLFG